MTNSMKLSAPLLAAFLSLAGHIAHAQDLMQCPPVLKTKQSIDGEQTGWQAFNSHEKHPYVSVSFSEGTPNKKIILAPSSEKKVRGKLLAVWTLPKSTEGYWVSCLYGETSVTVARKLPDDVSYCEVEYDRNFSQPVAKRWMCGAKAK